MNILRLEERKPCPSVVELLRDLLERAERGEILGVAAAIHCAGGKTSSAYSIGEGDMAHVVFALECLKARLVLE